LIFCPISTFLVEINSSVNVCLNCSEGCKSCISEMECLVCFGEYYLVVDVAQCVRECPNGTYLHGYLGQCLACRYPCENCSSVVLCTSCASGYLYSEELNKCYLTCPTGMFPDN
jgi:proprotein convertase subtilisin/kexin type 5